VGEDGAAGGGAGVVDFSADRVEGAAGVDGVSAFATLGVGVDIGAGSRTGTGAGLGAAEDAEGFATGVRAGDG